MPKAGSDVGLLAFEIANRRLKQDNSSLKSRLSESLKALEQCQLERDVALGVQAAVESVKPIKPRRSQKTAREATWVAMASDWHIEETVLKGTVNGVNSYNLSIARKRVERYFEGVAWLANYHAPTFGLKDGLLWLGGDLITGYLRDENLENNSLSPTKSIATLHTWISEGIDSLLRDTPTEKLKIICSSGNHGRLTKKTHHATRENNSIEWLLYHFLAREFAHESRVEFVLPEGAQTYAKIYDWTLRFHHGDDTKGGAGVGGIMIPIRKSVHRWNSVRRADITLLGHWHQYHDLSDLVINGSLIGYNPYALSIGAQYEEPTQAFFLLDSKRGKCMSSKVWVADGE